MSLSLHSSTGALTSSKRGSEKDSDIEPEKSSMGESSSSTSSRPPLAATSPRAVAISRQRGEPINHSNESVCTSRSPGTSSGSRSLAKETRLGAPGTELLAELFGRPWRGLLSVLLWRESAKMHPSSTSCEEREAGPPDLFAATFCWLGWRTICPDLTRATE